MRRRGIIASGYRIPRADSTARAAQKPNATPGMGSHGFSRRRNSTATPAPTRTKLSRYMNLITERRKSETSSAMLRLYPGAQHGILQRDDSRPGRLVTGQLQPHRPGRKWKQRNTSAEEDWTDGDLNRVHEPRAEDAPKERAAAEQPDVFSGLCPKGGQ